MINCAICGAHYDLVPMGQCTTCNRVTCLKCLEAAHPDLAPSTCKSCNTFPLSYALADIRQFSNDELIAELRRRGLLADISQPGLGKIDFAMTPDTGKPKKLDASNWP